MRKPFNVLVFPFYIDNNNEIKYALFKRYDGGYWQGISGGVEDDENMIEAAKRECYEETKINNNCEFIELDASASVPSKVFNCNSSWGSNVYVVKEVSFGVRVKEKELEISEEHSSFGWFTYEEANQLLKWDSNKVALWELNQRLLDNVIYW